MLEKILSLFNVIVGLFVGLVFMGAGVFLIKTNSSWVSWVAMVAIFVFSMLVVFICCMPLLNSFEKSNTELDYCPSEPDEPVDPEKAKVKLGLEPEKPKMGFFAPFQLI
jgi:hypothetical protein